MDVIEKVERIQEMETEYRDALSDLKEESKDIFDEYYKEFCGDLYEEIYNTLEDIRNHINGEKSIKKQREKMEQILVSSLNKLISRKTKVPIRTKNYSYYSRDSESDVVLSYYGIGIVGWGRAQKVEHMKSFKDIFKSDVKISNYVHKEGKKKILDTYQKYISKWIFVEKNREDTPERATINFRDENTIARFKEQTNNISVYFDEWSNYIGCGRYYSEGKMVEFNTSEITPYNCFLVYQAWDIIGDKLKTFRDSLKEAYTFNDNLMQKVINEVGHLLVAEEL